MKYFSFPNPSVVLLRGPTVLSKKRCEYTVILYPYELGPERLELGIVRFQRDRQYLDNSDCIATQFPLIRVGRRCGSPIFAPSNCGAGLKHRPLSAY